MSLKPVPPRPGKTPFWYLRGTFCGREHCVSTKARDEKTALRFKEQFELGLLKQEAEGRKPGTFRLAAELYKGFRRPSKRDQGWIDRLVGDLGEVELSDIRQNTLVAAANRLYPRGRAETKNRQALAVAASILHYAAECDLCPYIRVRKFKEKAPEARALSREDAERLIVAADGQLRLLLIWLFHQGWRISDVLRVKWQDIDLHAESVRYHISKIDEWRTMPLHPRVVKELKGQGDCVGRVFHWSDKSNLYRDLKPFSRRVGVRFTPHMARHSFATWLANDGVSAQELMEAGGWRDHKSVMRYAKLNQARVRSIINRIV